MTRRGAKNMSKKPWKFLTLVFWIVALIGGQWQELVSKPPMIRLGHRPAHCKDGGQRPWPQVHHQLPELTRNPQGFQELLKLPVGGKHGLAASQVDRILPARHSKEVGEAGKICFHYWERSPKDRNCSVIISCLKFKYMFNCDKSSFLKTQPHGLFYVSVRKTKPVALEHVLNRYQEVWVCLFL